MTKAQATVDIKVEPQDIANAFKFEPGDHIYLVEVKSDSMLTRDDLARLSKSLVKNNIKVQFIVTYGHDFFMQAIPAIEKKD